MYGAAGLGTKQDGKKTILLDGDPEFSRFWVQASNLVARMGDGVSAELYRHRGASLGNAVVPQIPELIGRAILQAINNCGSNAPDVDCITAADPVSNLLHDEGEAEVEAAIEALSAVKMRCEDIRKKGLALNLRLSHMSSHERSQNICG